MPKAVPEAQLRFAAALRDLRHQAGDPTEVQLAARMGCGRTSVSDILAGRRFPSWEMLSAFVTACGHAPEPWRERYRHACRELDAAKLGLSGSPASADAATGPPGIPPIPPFSPPSESQLPVRWYANNPEFYSAATEYVRRASQEVRVTYIRRYPPSQYTTTAASAYFKAVLDWAGEEVDEERTVRRIIGAPVVEGVPDAELLAWIRDHHGATKALLTYEIKILPWMADADGLNMALIDDRIAFVAFSGGPRQRLNGFSVEDPRFVGYFANYFEQLWSGLATVDSYLRHAAG